MSEGIIVNAFSATENAVIKSVERSFPTNRLSATVGSCCLVGVIWKGTLFVANLGDSRAVLGCVERSKKNLCFLGRSQKIVAKQLTMDQNADQEWVRQELQSLHPYDPSIVVHRNGAWSVKGLIQKQISRTPEAQKAYLKNASSFRLHFRISRSIGDVYLKKPGFDPGPSHPRFHLPQPICQAVLRSDPSISTRILRPSDKFLIFASDGLWDLLPNQKAVEMVHSNPRMGIARRLLARS